MQAERPALSCSPSLDALVHDHQQERRREGEGEGEVENESNGGEFEFSFDCAEAVSSPISADQIFHNGRIKPTLPLYEESDFQPEVKTASRRKALRRLFTEEKQSSSPSILSETVEASSTSDLGSVPSDTYCVWKPKTTPSGTSSKRWKLKDLLTRTGSEKDVQSQSKRVQAAPQVARKMAMKEGGGGGERRKSYLPYRPELVGIFGNSGSSRNVQRF